MATWIISPSTSPESIVVRIFTLVSYFSIRRIRHSPSGRIHSMVRDVSTKRLDCQVVIVLINFNR